MSLTGKFDEHRRRKAGKIEPQKTSEESNVSNFVTPGHIRNLSFVFLDGTREFFNYADLTSVAYVPKENKIVLNYREFYSVTLVGRNLDKLYQQLFGQVTREIACQEKRYEEIENENYIYVTEIIITKLNI